MASAAESGNGIISHSSLGHHSFSMSFPSLNMCSQGPLNRNGIMGQRMSQFLGGLQDLGSFKTPTRGCNFECCPKSLLRHRKEAG